MQPEEIKAIRISQGLTQAKFADALGVSVFAVRKWEHGQRQPGGAAIVLMERMKKSKYQFNHK